MKLFGLKKKSDKTIAFWYTKKNLKIEYRQNDILRDINYFVKMFDIVIRAKVRAEFVSKSHTAIRQTKIFIQSMIYSA